MFKEIINAYNKSIKLGLRTALATVVHVTGSSYRSPGARMLVDEKGNLTGAISGGCLEGDALRKALLVINQQQSKLVTYNTADEEDATVGIQLGCEGIIQVLFEPIEVDSEFNPINLLKRIVSKRENAVLITVFNSEIKNQSQLGTYLLSSNQQELLGELRLPRFENEILHQAKICLKERTSTFSRYCIDNESVTVFFEFIPPPIFLIIAGAGNDAIPLVNFANALTWEVSIVDGRNTHAKKERFISACQVVVSHPEKMLELFTIDNRTAFVLMTHNYNYDLALLRVIITKNLTYIGVLGPKKKLDRMMEALKAEGIFLNRVQKKSIHGPVGLDIGAETPEEIALSIVAEIKTVFSKKQGGFLKAKNVPIHTPRITTVENKILN